MLVLSLGNWWIWYEKVWGAIYLVLSDTKNLEISFDKHKNAIWWVPIWQSLNSYQSQICLFRLGKLPLIYAACFALSLVKLCWPLWEVCHAFKIKITYTPPKYALFLHWEWTTKICLICFHPPNKCSKFFKVFLQKRSKGFASYSCS